LSKYDAAEKLEAMADKMGMMSIPDAAKRVADLVEKCVEKC
jgi:UDP-N-acetylglucosamine:LPS N-acetylglucosamine transferase